MDPEVTNIPDWYEALVFAARAHVNSGSEPLLGFPDRDYLDRRIEFMSDIAHFWQV